MMYIYFKYISFSFYHICYILHFYANNILFNHLYLELCIIKIIKKYYKNKSIILDDLNKILLNYIYSITLIAILK